MADIEVAEMLDGDAQVVAGSPLPSARVPLDRDRIVSAAVHFIDTNGLTGLSMRRLATTLQVEAMSLYRYVSGREALLDAVVETIINEMYDDNEVLQQPENGWQDFLQRLAHGVRRIALAHPLAFPLVASRPPAAPWLRPPLRNLTWVEAFLAALMSEGFDDEGATAAYHAFTSFLLGHLLLEVNAHGADIGPLDILDGGEPDPDGLADYPTVERLSAALSEDHAPAEFEESLENLLNRLALMRTESQPPPT